MYFIICEELSLNAPADLLCTCIKKSYNDVDRDDDDYEYDDGDDDDDDLLTNLAHSYIMLKVDKDDDEDDNNDDDMTIMMIC